MKIRDHLRLVYRSLTRSPRFTIIVLLTLAVSMSSSTAMFSIVDTFLLSSLPFKEPDSLAVVWSIPDEPSASGQQERFPLTPGVFTDLEDLRSFSEVGGLMSDFVNVSIHGEARRAHCIYVLGDVFSLLGIEPAMGRPIRPDDLRSGAQPAVVISHGFWLRQFGGDPDVIGRTLNIYRGSYEVVGVLPAEFRFTESLEAADSRLSKPADLWTTFELGERADQRGFRYLLAIGRLHRSASLEGAQQELDAYARHAAKQYPDTDKGYGLAIVPLDQQIFGHLRPVLLLLLAATMFVLLVACANLATIQLARNESRQRGVAVQLALGASRFLIALQSLLESLVLAIVGGLLALPVASFGLRLLPKMDPPEVFQSYPPEVDYSVLLVTIGIAAIMGLLFGSIPAVSNSRADAASGLREGSSRLAGAKSRWVFSSLAVVQLSLATALLIGTGLSVRSFWGLMKADLGFAPARIATLDLHLPRTPYRDKRLKTEFLGGLLEGASSLPGVESVGMNYALPFSGVEPSNSMLVQGVATSPGEYEAANLGLVNAEYFQTLGIPLLRGRLFQVTDTQDSTPVAIIDQRMVDQFFPNQDPLGQWIRIASDEELTVVGVVGSIIHDALNDKARPYVYLPYLQRSYLFTTLAIKTRHEDPSVTAKQVRNLVHSLDPAVPISNVSTLTKSYETAIRPQRFSMLLISIFAGIALFLTLVGTYGVLSFLARQRRKEVGIRMALGASPQQAFFLMVRQGLVVSGTGTALGLLIALASRHSIASLVHGTATIDPVVFTLVPAFVLLAAFLAYLVPAHSVSRVEPSTSLR